ncbi:D-alanyl-D-alanine carboxypeptidase family protein [Clostridium rectalis]|uniref:D-alanyl-D-alanine carboxypeptidase family protein n=1 Tax=Clostridium rectalis TaxID=2040295 RepID=UPI000F63BF21|nr:D-alanyl-D-alanine carboxypeptidase family protein [Clostridium rectalis]
MKRLLIFLLFFVILLNSNIVKAKDTLPKVSADGAVIMDATTGNILYEKNANSTYPPASTTKIMTALLTLENCKLNDLVTVGKTPPLADGSKIYIFEGETLKIKDLLYALLLGSANDCAEALAEHISGSTSEFAKLMNKRAKELGCTSTNFVNPSGLYDEKHRTSAKDLALIMRELVKYPDYISIATTSAYKISPTNKCKESRPLWNENKLVQKLSSSYFNGCEGGKTGYTIQSEHSYVASATKNNERIIVSLLHDKNKTFFPDTINLFNYAFKNFKLIKLYSKGDVVKTVKSENIPIELTASDDFYYVTKKENLDKPTIQLENRNLNNVTFKKGDVISNATIKIKDTNIGSIKLVSNCDHVVNKSFFANKNSNVLKIIIVCCVFLAGIFIITFTIKLKRKIRANN